MINFEWLFSYIKCKIKSTVFSRIYTYNSNWGTSATLLLTLFTLLYVFKKDLTFYERKNIWPLIEERKNGGKIYK